MTIKAEIIESISTKWNLNISQAAAAELVARHGTTAPIDQASFKTILLNTGIQTIVEVCNKGSSSVVMNDSIVPSREVQGLPHPLFCQIDTVIDITQPKYTITPTENPSKAIYKVTLNTGYIRFQGLFLDSNQKIHVFAPGTKLLLMKPGVKHVDTMAFLKPGSYEILGGIVPDLYDPWKLQREVSIQRYSTGGKPIASDAPKFEPLPLLAKQPVASIADQMKALSIKAPQKKDIPKAGKQHVKLKHGAGVPRPHSKPVPKDSSVPFRKAGAPAFPNAKQQPSAKKAPANENARGQPTTKHTPKQGFSGGHRRAKAPPKHM
ncbi:uncharacterized protein BBOV_IV002480 [Babesia bovis T2Bo]|uniref:RecQ mediated genome instability protein 1 OB-fold domain-containing protein n=1 Tax=Babesia bovis TaxID=5865 RepID=A7AVL9_BABBO|nr:uncharacterized protein BBOV_IV002480 [Babesia bovis T2Bo]EDO05845.1 hypothetical protein BBOV_IV002480 [Babesia bovis T2Bo]|eukprot:XP_001609413.1 hypothetical protein [Babesia bovis T2Bo]